MIDLQALKALDQTALHYQVQFQGKNEIMALIEELECSEWEFDYFLSEKLMEVLKMVNFSGGLVVTFGKEYSRVLYFGLIPGYPEIGTYEYAYHLLDKIQNLGWQASEYQLIGTAQGWYPNAPKLLEKDRKLRIWWG